MPGDPWSAFPGDFIPSHDTAVGWLLGLGSNRKAPADVLIRLLDAGRPWFLFRRDLPPGVIDAAVVHPRKRVWMMAAEEHHLSPQQWDRLLAATAGVPRMHELALELAEERAQERRPGSALASRARLVPVPGRRQRPRRSQSSPPPCRISTRAFTCGPCGGSAPCTTTPTRCGSWRPHLRSGSGAAWPAPSTSRVHHQADRRS